MATSTAPPPPSRENQTPVTLQILSPKHAAIPYTPVQETNPCSVAPDHAQDENAPAPVPEGLQASVSHVQEGSDSASEENYTPVQETDPAPQTQVQQNEGATFQTRDTQDLA